MTNPKCGDPIVESVVAKFRERSKVGVKKYGTTLEDSQSSLLEWCNHTQEELMDAVNYLEKTMNILKNNNKNHE
jgi:hypothetical protein